MVGRPDSQVGIFGVRADQNHLRQSAFGLAAVVKGFIECAARHAEVAGVSVEGTARPEMTCCAAEVGHAEEIPAHAKIQREVWPNLPVVLEEPVEFVLMVLTNLSSRSLRLARMVVRSLVVQELRVRGLPCFKALRYGRNRARKESQHVLRQTDVAGEHARNLVHTRDGDITEAAGSRTSGLAANRRN